MTVLRSRRFGSRTRTVLLVAAMSAACGGASSCSSVQPPDVVGTWVMTERSRRLLPEEVRKAAAEIVLDAKGTFVATDVPGLFANDERGTRVLDSGRGVWRLASLGGEPQLLLEFRHRSNTIDSTPFGRGLHLSREGLFYFIGDPDAGLRLSFERP